MKKRVLSALLALCLAFSLFGTALAAAAAETTAAPVSASSAEGQTDLAVTDDTSGETAAPEETETPAETPEETETQAVTETPEETGTPDETGSSEETETQAGTEMPGETETQAETETPEENENQDMTENLEEDEQVVEAPGDVAVPMATVVTTDIADTSDKVSISLYDYSDDINGGWWTENTQGAWEYVTDQFMFSGGVTNYVNNKNEDNDYQGKWYNTWTGSGAGVTQGIVEPELVNGYPVLAPQGACTVEGEGKNSLAYLFGGTASDKVSCYENLNGLFFYNESTGYYSYDSSRNFATLDPDGDGTYSSKFTVYAEGNTGTSSGASGCPYFLPFNMFGTNEDSANYHFGMKIETSFMMPENGKVHDQDMIFSFAGDDDVWVYIDGVLVLDMGGVHDSNTGEINFAAGTATVDKVYYDNGNLENNQSSIVYIGDALYAAKSGDQDWIDANLEQRGGHWYLKDYTNHTLSFFYLERGAVDSNCKIEFNLPVVSSSDLTVTKTANENAPADQDYTFALYQADVITSVSGASYTVYSTSDWVSGNTNNSVTTGTTDGNGRFTLQAGQTAVFSGFYTQGNINSQYVVKEITDDLGSSFTDVTLSGGVSRNPSDDSITVARQYSNVTFNNIYTAIPTDLVDTEKEAVLNDDGTYDLTLAITGDTQSSTTTTSPMVDILFILDESGSMDYNLYEDEDAGWHEDSRMDLLKSSVRTLVNAVKAKNIDARYSAVSFSRSQFRNQVEWTDAAGVMEFVNNLDPNGGTNYQQGISDGKTLLKSARENAVTYVIFVSDGIPTYRGINVTNETNRRDEDRGYGNGVDDDQNLNIAAAVTEITTMSCDYFYAIGMGPDFGQNRFGGDLQGTTNLKSLAGAVGAPAGNTDVFSATDTDSLNAAFNDIITSITTSFGASHVVVTDPLSEYADLVPVAGSNDNVTYQMTLALDHDGAQVDTELVTLAETQNVDTSAILSGITVDEGSNAVIYAGPSTTLEHTEGSESAHTVTMTPYIVIIEDTEGNVVNEVIRIIFDENYTLTDDYRYSFITLIEPSEQAYTAYGQNGGQHPTDMSGENDTGTHSGENGFWSNDNANARVDFVVGGEEQSEGFPDPVIQVTSGNLGLTKQVQDQNGNSLAMDAANTVFNFTITGPVSTYYAQPKRSSTAEDGTVSWSELGYLTDNNDRVVFELNEEQTAAVATVTITGEGNLSIQGLPVGDYTVSESTPNDIDDDYYFTRHTFIDNSGNENDGEVTVVKSNIGEDGEDRNAVSMTITNIYAPYYTLTIEKQVTGGMGDTSEFFDFFTSVSRGDVDVAVNSGNATDNDLDLGFVLTTQGTNARYNSDDIVDNYGFQLADNGTLTITKLKADDVVTLAETDANANGYETTYAGAEAVSDESGNYTVTVGSEDAVTVEGDSTTLKVTVTNHRDPATPTDADANSAAPYLVLTACAAFAGLALAGSIVAVRLRRRRQE